MGLQIFNIDTECVETWNGVTWIQACYNNTPTVPPVPSSAVACVTPNTGSSDNFIAIADPAATKYEFFVGGISKGKQPSNVLTLSTATAASQITVAYYYPLSYLQPTMLSIPGNEGNNWYYNTPTGGGTGIPTSASIPAFKMSETPITQAQFDYVMEKNPSLFQCSYSPYYTPSSAKPVEQVNWYDAITYCNKLSILERKTPCYSIPDIAALNLTTTPDGSGWVGLHFNILIYQMIAVQILIGTLLPAILLLMVIVCPQNGNGSMLLAAVQRTFIPFLRVLIIPAIVLLQKVAILCVRWVGGKAMKVWQTLVVIINRLVAQKK
jgi:hypothetical protein